MTEELWIDSGLLTPVAAGWDAEVGDPAVVAALVRVEAALTRAWSVIGAAPQAAADAVSTTFGWDGAPAPDFRPEALLQPLVRGGVSGGNPVIPLVGLLRDGVPGPHRGWVHRGATSQDILDSALMIIAHRAATSLLDRLDRIDAAFADFAREHRDEVAAARTLTQHAVPTTIGARAAGWLRGIRRARMRLAAIRAELPAQLGGAGGTLAAMFEVGGSAARDLPAAFAAELGLAAPDAPWHTQRWPVTELGDALAQVTDALGKVAADIATLSRTEIGELAEGVGGGSSAMPQKQNPARSVLVRSAAIRAPHLVATLHSAAALAVDERPDGSWHAEWPALRELLRLALGASGLMEAIASGLTVRHEAIAWNLGMTRGLIVSERLMLVLAPVIGADRVQQIVARTGAGADLATVIAEELAAAGAGDAIDVDALVDPAGYTGLAPDLVDRAVDSTHHHPGVQR